jgi:SNF2 family DNA or RNA helicase
VRVEWDEDADGPVNKPPKKAKVLWKPNPPKRKPKNTTTTGVGVRRRRGALVPQRSRKNALNFGDSDSETTYPTRQPDNKPYNPPEPIEFSGLNDENSIERPCFDTATSAAKEDLLLPSGGIIPGPIAQWLRSYQVEGVEYMYRLWKEGRGGILGDDMGLGSMSL